MKMFIRAVCPHQKRYIVWMVAFCHSKYSTMTLVSFFSRFISVVFFTRLASSTVIGKRDTFQTECGIGSYGWPKVEDCHTLLETFANFQDNGLRYFDEEQIRVDARGSWPGVDAIFGPSRTVPVTQIPRYYTLSMSFIEHLSPADGFTRTTLYRCMLIPCDMQGSCNFALMSYAEIDADNSGLGGTSWAKINAGGTFIINKCLRNPRAPSGGVVVIPSGESLTCNALCRN